jgi:two-component system chemotaxis response regulator CheY
MTNFRPSHGIVVDDDRVHLDMIAFLLQRMGFSRVARFLDAEEALAYVVANGVDLIVSDFEMAPVNGLAFLRAVRSDPRLRKAPFLMLTASLDETNWKLSIESGATEFLFKPLSASGFRDAISTCLDVASPRYRSSHEIARTGRVGRNFPSVAAAANSAKRGAARRRDMVRTISLPE